MTNSTRATLYLRAALVLIFVGGLNISPATGTTGPGEENCAAADDVLTSPTQGLAIVDLGMVRIIQARDQFEAPIPLDVEDCSGDGSLDVLIPRSDSSGSQFARIEMGFDLCNESAPEVVEITLVAPTGCILYGRDGQFNLVATVNVPASPLTQTLVLSDAFGIRRIEVEGVSVCIVLVCWECMLPAETPTPSPTPDPNIAGCVEIGDFVTEPTSGLIVVDIGPLTFSAPLLNPKIANFLLSLVDCSEDGRLDVLIPSSFGFVSNLARIDFNPNVICPGLDPISVAVTLQHGGNCIIYGKDPFGPGVITQAAANPGGGIQTVQVSHVEGIEAIWVEGTDVCITEVCWTCSGPIPTLPPTPTPGPIPVGCVSADDFFQSETFGLSRVDLGPVVFEESIQITSMDITDCSGDDGVVELDISQSSFLFPPQVIMTFDQFVCSGQDPRTVELVLNDSAGTAVQAHDSNDVLVAEATATASSTETLVLSSPSGIHSIVFNGEDICILKICWFCDIQLPPPGPGGCVEADDFFATPVSGLPQVPLGLVTLTQAVDPGSGPVPLDVVDCSNDGRLDMLIPWSEASANPPARIGFNPDTCLGPPKFGGNPPEFVVVTLLTSSPCVLHGLDASGAEVATITATNQALPQTLVLSSPSRILNIDVEGSNVCILEVCWLCQAPPLTPTPTPVPIQPNSDCVIPDDFFTGPVTDLPTVDLGPITMTAAVILKKGTTGVLNVVECSGDSALDVEVPFSESSAVSLARIDIASDVVCLGQAPVFVEVTLVNGNQCILHGLDPNGTEVATVVAASQATSQTLILNHFGGILSIEIEGSEVCIQEICWICEEEPPTPTPTATSTITPTPRGVVNDCALIDDFFSAPMINVPEVTVGPIRFIEALMSGGTPAPLSVVDCGLGSRLNLSIPWTEATASRKAIFEFDGSICDGNATQFVRVSLRHDNQALIRGLNDAGQIVDSAAAALGPQVQELVLAAPSGIRSVEFEGSEICVVEVCWICKLGEFIPTSTPTSSVTETPLPTPTPSVTDTPLPTPTFTLTDTPSPSSTETPTNTSTLTETQVPSFTEIPVDTPTETGTNTVTLTPTITATVTATITGTLPTPTDTGTMTETPTASDTPTETGTETGTSTVTSTPTMTATFTPTLTGTRPTPTITNTPGDLSECDLDGNNSVDANDLLLFLESTTGTSADLLFFARCWNEDLN